MRQTRMPRLHSRSPSSSAARGPRPCASVPAATRVAIEPAKDGLLCAVIGPRGLYYASKTLQQLVLARREGTRVELPLARVEDWPDMQDRGLWGGDASLHLRWMSDRKMNHIEHISHTAVDRNGHTSVSFAP